MSMGGVWPRGESAAASMTMRSPLASMAMPVGNLSGSSSVEMTVRTPVTGSTCRTAMQNRERRAGSYLAGDDQIARMKRDGANAGRDQHRKHGCKGRNEE